MVMSVTSSIEGSQTMFTVQLSHKMQKLVLITTNAVIIADTNIWLESHNHVAIFVCYAPNVFSFLHAL